MSERLRSTAFLLTTSTLLAGVAGAATPQDWPTWGRDETRNMASPEAKGLPGSFEAGDFVGASDEIDMATTKNVKWIAKLGSQSYGNPVISDGRIYVGTNNDTPRDPRFKGDRATVYAFEEDSGDFLWQLNCPKLGTGKVSDWEYLGICCSPTVEGDRIYIVTNRCEVMCLDANGMSDGNQGYQDEGKYMAWSVQEGDKAKPMDVAATDADILWVYNMIDELGVFPHNITTSSVLLAGDLLWVTTSNGVDYGHVETPAPQAPSLILMDKNTGELLGEEASGLSSRIFHSNWSSPTYLRTDDVELCIFGGPDGVCYAFEKTPIDGPDGWPVLKEAWRYDCNPPEYREKDGKKITYTDRYGPSEILGTPITYDGLVYCVIGQDPEHGEGIGNLTCIDPTGKEVWSYRDINRSLSTMAAMDGLLFVADFSGFVYCFDAKSGELQWRHDTKGHIWASPMVADGKVYIGNEDGFMTILPATNRFFDEDGNPREYDPKKDMVEVDMISPIYSSAVTANGVLYVATHTHLYAIEEGATPSKTQ